MKTFAWFIPLRNLDDFFYSYPKGKNYFDKKMKVEELKGVLLKLPPYVYLKIKNTISVGKISIEGYVIILPLLPTQIVVDKMNILNKLESAFKISKELGVNIISLGGLLGLYGQEAVEIARGMSMHVTTGLNYTAAIVTEAIKKAAVFKRLELNNAKITLLGLDTPLGDICLKILNKHDPTFIFVENIDKKFNEIDNSISNVNFKIEKKLGDALKKSEIVLITTGSLSVDIDPADLNAHTIVCDAIHPFLNAKKIFKMRNDVLAFEGTRVAQYSFLNRKSSRKWSRIFSGDDIYSCIGEAMILAFEDRFENYSLSGKKTSVERVAEIYNLGIRHGFQVANFMCSKKIYSENELKRILLE